MAYELCPGCARRFQNPRHGVCDNCYDDELRIKAEEKERDHYEARRANWRDRQRRHRDRERLAPQEPLDEDADPIAVGEEIVNILLRVKKSITNATNEALLDHAIDQVKALSWGPEISERRNGMKLVR